MATSGGQTFNVTIGANMDVSGVLSAVKQMQGAFNGLKIDPNMTGNLTKEFGNLQKLLDTYRKSLDKGITSKNDLKNLEKLEKEINSSFSSINRLYSELNGQTFITKVDSSKLDELKIKTKEAQQALQNAFADIKIGTGDNGLSAIENSIQKAVSRSKTLKNSFSDIFSGLTSSGDIKQFSSGLDSIFGNLKNKLEAGKLQPTVDNLLKSFKSLGLIQIDLPTESAEQKIAALQAGFTELKTAIANGASGEELQGLIQNLETATKVEKEFIIEAEKRGKIQYDKQVKSAEALAEKVREGTQAEREFQQATLSATQQVQQLQQSTQYFFSLRNMINLLKRGIREAVDTVKELDAVMTETAVVTKFDVSDMWAKLPEYTANANALGATVKDMYEATTLYYQQGLNTDQAMSIATETMKMARIAGLEAAEATDMMTAALRGFNMEINETSAQRINDVYSNLAAKTASNTEELGTAMQRTASIAANAGMSFEGTAAFLAQAIETTREPAENIGTAMKTIVARFTELKKNPLEIAEVDGEEVSYNKVDTALQSIGVSLKDANGQFRDLDQVFLDISQRWDGLTQTQQRYIATTAAGSRQQSRFIAMMSNYDRTMELMDYANNASGASNEQFGKTLDSLEAKLNKFQNAWKEFLMKIMNDSWTKGIIDGATKVLNTVNKLIDTLSFGNKGIKSALSLFTAFTGLKMAGKGANMLIGGLGGLVDPNSSVKEGMRGGALGGQAARISNPIVKAIYSLIPHIDKAATGLQYKGYGDYKGAKKDLKSEMFMGNIGPGLNLKAGKYSLAGINSIFSKNGLNEAQQKALYASFPGLKHSMTNTLAKVLQESGADPQTTKGLIAGFKKGDFTSAQVLEKAGVVRSFSSQMKTIGEKSGEEAANAFRRAETKELVSNGLDKKIVQQGKDLGYKGKDLTNYVRGEIDKRVNSKTYATSDKAQGALDAEHQLTKAEKAANAFGKVGGALSSAGMSLQMFGAQLSTTNPVLGEMVSKMGSLLSTAGAIPNMISSIIAGGPAVWAVTAAVTALGAAFLYVQHQEQKIKDAAEEVNKNFEETNKQTQDNISSLKGYQSELAVLAKGVDANGNNVNLSDADYARYLEIVDDIAAMNPEIVEGYNAQGHAIIDNNKALAETLEKQKEIRDEAVKQYTDAESLNKLIAARNINKDYNSATRTLTGKKASKWQEDQGVGGPTIARAAPMTNTIKKLAEELKNQEGIDVDSVLSSYGITLEQLEAGEEQAVNKFVKNQDQIHSQLASSITGTLSDSIVESFDGLGEETAKFDEAVAPLVQNLQTYASNLPAFESIGPEFRSALMSGLKNIAIQPDIDADQMQDQAELLVQKFENLTGEGSEYADALEIVTEAQDNFAASLDETQYETDVQPAIDELVRLKEEALDEGTVYGDALAEYLETQIQQIARFTEEGTTTIQDGLNTATEAIAEAESALEGFNKATEKDFWTASEGMKSIYDKIFETYEDSYGNKVEKHTEGEGDNTFWTGAEALLSPDKLKGGVEIVSQSLKDLEPWLREGKEGMDAFFSDVINNPNLKKLEEEGLIKLDENGWFEEIPEGQWKAVADALGISEELLTSMLNKARQFGLISFDNLDKVREALATDEGSIAGTKTNKAGQKELYVKEDTLRANLREAGYNTTESQDKVIKQLAKEQNVHTVKTMDNLTSKAADKLVKAWDVKDLPDLITKMSKTGEYSREEILDLAEKSGLGSGEAAAETYDEIIRALDNPELAEQTSELQSINAKLDAITDKVTGKGVEEHENLQEEAHEASLGDNGVATMFAAGRDVNGNLLDEGSFAVIRDELESTKKQYEENAQYYEERAKLANKADRERFEKLAELYKNDADAIGKAIDSGNEVAEKKKNVQKNKNKNKKEKEDKEGSKKAPSSGYTDTGTGGQKTSNASTPQQASGTQRADKRDIIYDTHVNDDELKDAEKTGKEIQKEASKGFTWDFLVNDTEVDDSQKKIDDISAIASSRFAVFIGANYPELAEAYGLVQDVQETSNKGTDFQARADSSQVDAVKSKIASIAGKVFSTSITIATGNAISNLTSIYNLLVKIINNKSKVTNIGHRTTGVQRDATGTHNHGTAAIPVIGSAARGGYGRLGPKGKGGPTLTGELGYEIAWLPSENRSMILGANGPQMINLPGDAVVWTHEQSKKILKQKAIPAGSHSGPSAKGSSKNYVVTYPVTYSSVAASYYRPSKKNTSSQPQTDAKHLKTVKQMDYWWEQISRQVKTAERISDRLGDKTTKILNDIRASIGQVNKVNKTFVKAQKDNIALNQAIVVNSEKKLKALRKGGKNKKGDNWQTVEWQTKNGNKSQDHNRKINLSKFISVDANGTYYVNEKKINTIKSKEQKQAISEKAYEVIDKWQDRRNDAQDAINKAQEALTDYRKQIDDTFFGWKNELTQIYKITGEIEKLEAKINKEKSQYSLTQTKLDLENQSFGMTKNTTKYLKNLKEATDASKKYYQQEINNKQKLIDNNAFKAEQSYYGALTKVKVKYETINGTTKTVTEQQRYKQLQKIGKNGSGKGWDELSENDKRIYARGTAFNKGYIIQNADKTYSFDVSKIERDRKKGLISNELYNLIKENYDTLHQLDLDRIQTETDLIDLEQARIEAEEQYNDTVAQLAEQLYGWQNTLTKILELTNKIEQTEKRTAFLKQADEYYTAKRQSGRNVDSSKVLSTYTGQMISTVTQVQASQKLLQEQRADLQKFITGQDITTQIANLKKQSKNDARQKAIQNLEDELKIRALAQKYVKTTANADGTVNVTFKSSELAKDIGKEFDVETAGKIEEYAQELVDKNNAIQDTLTNNLTNITELYNELINLRQAYADSAKELREAYSAQQQRIIDNLKTIYSTIDNAFKELINQVKQSIQQRRRSEDNAKTEKDISKKQQRLAMLRADTSGGNQVAIAQLQREIADAQQSYGRTLEDQLLDKISQQGDEAAKQRQQQIDLLQAQRTIAEKTGRDAALINAWLNNPAQHEAEMRAVLNEQAGVDAMTAPERSVHDAQLDATIASYSDVPGKIDLVNTAIKSLDQGDQGIDASINSALSTAEQAIITAFGQELATIKTDVAIIGEFVGAQVKAKQEVEKQRENKLAEQKSAQVKLGSVQSQQVTARNAFIEATQALGNATVQRDKAQAEYNKVTNQINSLENALAHYISQRAQARNEYERIVFTEQINATRTQLNNARMNQNNAYTILGTAKNNYAKALSDKGLAQTVLTKADAEVSKWQTTVNTITTELKALEEKLSTFKFASGGLATQTGPAWLDGTPSKPELVLNATDTKNFIALKDILSRAMGSINSTNNANYGDILYEININVDKIEKDYDVDRVVDRVKKEIVKGASYRNVTQVRNLR